MDIELLTISNPITNNCNKIAAFDFDWTLVKPKENRKFPKSVDDWDWLYSNIPNIIKQLYDDGHIIVIFTNQSKQWKHDQIINVAETLNIPIYILIAFNKDYYKPNIALYEKFINQIGNIDKDRSFFVGDALGRKDDFSNSDRLFAENIGIKWMAPEDIFYKKQEQQTLILPNIQLEDISKEIIILVGYPGSGKSTIADNICLENSNYICIKGDIYKTSEYIEFGKKYGYTNFGCIYVTTSMEISYQRNKTRPEDKQVPRIAYSVYNKYFEEPDGNLEHFTLVIV